MNDTQKKILIGAAVAIVCALLYPPFHFRYANGIVLNLGYGFIFDPPLAMLGDSFRDGAVTISVLIIEWAAIVIVASILFLITRK